jgi:hypothetical protein
MIQPPICVGASVPHPGSRMARISFLTSGLRFVVAANVVGPMAALRPVAPGKRTCRRRRILASPTRSIVSWDDAADIALSAALDAPLVTSDRQLAAVPGLPCDVEPY